MQSVPGVLPPSAASRAATRLTKFTDTAALSANPNSTRPNTRTRKTGSTSANSTSACPPSDEVVGPRRLNMTCREWPTLGRAIPVLPANRGFLSLNGYRSPACFRPSPRTGGTWRLSAAAVDRQTGGSADRRVSNCLPPGRPCRRSAPTYSRGIAAARCLDKHPGATRIRRATAGACRRRREDGDMRRAIIAILAAATLTISGLTFGPALRAHALGETSVTLNCNDGTSRILSVDADALAQLTAAVQAMIDYPAGLS